MRILITRHGQPAIGDLPPGVDHQFPPADPSLTALGRAQAAWLGARLAATGFAGRIFSSPYRRTLETADVVADMLHAWVTPEPAIQEYVPGEGKPTFEGLTLEVMHRAYPRVKSGGSLPFPWFVTGPEGSEEVIARVRPFIETLLDSGDDEALLVGHGASVYGVIRLLIPDDGEKEEFDVVRNWNCSLTVLDVESLTSTRRILDFDVSHIPPDSVTSNSLWRCRGD